MAISDIPNRREIQIEDPGELTAAAAIGQSAMAATNGWRTIYDFIDPASLAETGGHQAFWKHFTLSELPETQSTWDIRLTHSFPRGLAGPVVGQSQRRSYHGGYERAAGGSYFLTEEVATPNSLTDADLLRLQDAVYSRIDGVEQRTASTLRELETKLNEVLRKLEGGGPTEPEPMRFDYFEQLELSPEGVIEGDGWVEAFNSISQTKNAPPGFVKIAARALNSADYAVRAAAARALAATFPEAAVDMLEKALAEDQPARLRPALLSALAEARGG